MRLAQPAPNYFDFVKLIKRDGPLASCVFKSVDSSAMFVPALLQGEDDDRSVCSGGRDALRAWRSVWRLVDKAGSDACNLRDSEFRAKLELLSYASTYPFMVRGQLQHGGDIRQWPMPRVDDAIRIRGVFLDVSFLLRVRVVRMANARRRTALVAVALSTIE